MRPLYFCSFCDFVGDYNQVHLHEKTCKHAIEQLKSCTHCVFYDKGKNKCTNEKGNEMFLGKSYFTSQQPSEANFCPHKELF